MDNHISSPVILVVDDDDVLRAQLSRSLEKRGFEVHTASGGAEAFARCSTSAITHVVLDLCMPEQSGISVLETLLARHPSLSIVVLTGYGSIATAVESIKFGAKQYLTKPVETDDVIEALLGHVSPTITRPRQQTIEEREWEYIQQTLNRFEGNISHAAKALGLHRRSLQRKLQKYSPVR